MPPIDPPDVRRVAVLGTGIIGAGWTAYFLSRGLSVAATDPAPGAQDRLRRFIDRAWPLLAELGLAEGADPAAFTFSSHAAAALEGAQFVQECAPERIETKRIVFGLARARRNSRYASTSG